MKKGSYVIMDQIQGPGVVLEKKNNVFTVIVLEGTLKNRIVRKTAIDLKEIPAPKLKYNFEVGDEISFNGGNYLISEIKGNLARIVNKEKTKEMKYDLPLSSFELINKNNLDIKEGDFVKVNDDICIVGKISKSGKANLYLDRNIEGRYYKNVSILGLEKIDNVKKNNKPESLKNWEIGKNTIFGALSEETVARETLIKYKGKNVLILTNRGHGDPDNISPYNYKDKTNYLEMFANDLRSILSEEQIENMEEYSKKDDALISTFIDWNDNGIIQNFSLEEFLDGSYYKKRFDNNHSSFNL